MNRFSLRLLILVLVAGSIALNAMAQASKVDDPFRFSLGASAEITDNRDSAPDDQKKTNIDYYISPKLVFKSRPGDASTMLFSYNPMFRYRTKPSLTQNDSEVYHHAKLDFRKKSSDIQETRVIDHFAYTDDPAVTQNGTLFRRDSSFIYNSLVVGMNKKVQKVNTFDIYALYNLKRYDEAEIAQESDEDNYSLNMLYLKQYQRKSALAFELKAGGTDYEELNGADRSYMDVIGAIGIEHIASPSLRLSARVGAQFVDYADSSLGSVSSPTFRLSAIGSTIPTVSFSGTLDHRVRDSDVFPFASQEATDLRGGIDWALKEQNVVLNAAATYHRGSYTRDALPSSSFSSSTGDETGTILEAGAAYKHSSATTFAVKFLSEDVSSDTGVSYGRNFTRNTTTFSVAKQF